MAYDFRAWLNTKPDDQRYDYMNCQGNCAVGQYMKEVLGESWSIDRYNEHVAAAFPPGDVRGHRALQTSRTFGELKAKILEPA